jgi:hypothetical protein
VGRFQLAGVRHDPLGGRPGVHGPGHGPDARASRGRRCRRGRSARRCHRCQRLPVPPQRRTPVDEAEASGEGLRQQSGETPD